MVSHGFCNKENVKNLENVIWAKYQSKWTYTTLKSKQIAILWGVCLKKKVFDFSVFLWENQDLVF